MMDKKPIIVIAVPDACEFYRAIPLWDERIEVYPAAAPPHHRKQLHADLAIIDCCFDDERGLQLLREMKLNHPAMPMIFMTDAGSEDAAIAAFRIGARDYVKKPVNLVEFRNALADFLAVKRSGSLGVRRRFIADRNPRDRANSDLPANLLRAVRFVKENFARPVSIDQMAQEAGLSKCHFCRVFKKATNMTPMHFLSRMRIKRSRDLIRKDLPISTIAIKVGFNDLSSFNRHFKRFTGQTPTQYRDSLQRNS